MYTPHTGEDVASMLAAVGVDSLDELVRVAPHLAPREAMNVAPGLSERDLRERFTALAAENTGASLTSFLGAGVHAHYVPPVIGTLAMRGEFLTAYTPYQAEVSQGYLQAIYEWQTYIALLTGLELANASVYDGATALAEAVIMAVNATGRRRVAVASTVHPQFRAVLETYAAGIDVDVVIVPAERDGLIDYDALRTRADLGDFAAFAVQSPNFFGLIEQPPPEAVGALKSAGCIPIAVTAEAMSLAVLTPPGEWGAEIAVGEAQSFGIAPAYGGPYAGFIACSETHLRRMPGRLVGRTVDRHGNNAYTLTLQAREQHIRREKATSNICTNQAHCALIATIYLTALGERGLRDCATLNLRQSRALMGELERVLGVRRLHDGPFFNEFVIEVAEDPELVLRALAARGILGGLSLRRYYPEYPNAILVTATELTTDEQISTYAKTLRELLRQPLVGAITGSIHA